MLHDAVMPTAIELRLKASWPIRPDTKQLHGLACALFEGAGSNHYSQEKPFSVSPLVPVSADNWDWQAAWLRDELPPASVLAPEKIRVGHVICTVTEARHFTVSHAQLAASPPSRTVKVEFCSPTYFSHNGGTVVTPDPRLIVGSWRQRWNASLPAGDQLIIGEEIWQAAQRCIRLADFALQTGKLDSGRGYDRTGFTGRATLRTAPDAPAEVQALLGTLARFAEFSGTGSQPTHGFGATILLG